MKKVNWWIVGTIAVLVAFLLFGGGMMSGWGVGGYGMMSRGYSPFGWFGMGIGMLFMWLVPVGILALIVFGITSLTRNNGNPTPPASQASCSNCGKGIQTDWQTCPYCGTSLK